MPRRFSLLVFDVDGTLVDSIGLIARSIQAACRDLGVTVPDDPAARHVIGLGLNEAIACIAPGLSVADARRLSDRYRHHYLAGDAAVPLFDGVREAIPELHQAGFQLAIATGKSRAGLDRMLEATGLRPWFQGSRCADEVPFGKPYPHMLLELLDEMSVLPAEAVMIGDTSHDLLMARNAGTAGIAAAWGAHPGDDLDACQPLASFATFRDLHQWLLTNA